jgi:hypothetical protein
VKGIITLIYVLRFVLFRLVDFFLSMADLGTARSPRVTFVSRCNGVSPEMRIFIASAFCPVEAAAWTG